MRGLLAARDDGSTLVLPEGRARVMSARKLGSERYAGIVEVTSGEEPTRQAEQESYSEQKPDVSAAGPEPVIPDLGGWPIVPERGAQAGKLSVVEVPKDLCELVVVDRRVWQKATITQVEAVSGGVRSCGEGVQAGDGLDGVLGAVASLPAASEGLVVLHAGEDVLDAGADLTVTPWQC